MANRPPVPQRIGISALLLVGGASILLLGPLGDTEVLFAGVGALSLGGVHLAAIALEVTSVAS